MFTPPLRELTPETSLGFECIDFADWVHARLQQIAAERGEPDIAELVPRLLDWQRWLLIHALELLAGPGKIFRFRTVLLLVARQNGKTVALIYLILWRLFTDGSRMVIGTAQSLEIAEEAWDLVVAIAEAIPELEVEIDRVRRTNGKQALVLETRERYKVAPSTRGGGRGLSGGELVIMDELREHQTWAAYSSVSKTTMARARAQVWGVSSAGDAGSIVLRHLRTVALAAIEGTTADDAQVPDDLDESAIGLFEWSAGDDPRTGQPRSIWDRDGWALANPSLGYSQLSEKAIAAAAGTDPEWVFRTEVLTEFVNTAGAGPFPNGSWAQTLIPSVVRDPARPVAYCVDLSHDRTIAHVAIAFWDIEGRRRVEIAASRAGTDWVIPWLRSPDRAVPAENVTIQSNGAPVSSMTDEFAQAGIELTPWLGRDLSGWTGLFYDGIRRALDDADAPLTLTHGAQPVLDLAANSARIRALSDGWVIDRRNSPEDAAPLVAAIGALGLLNTNPVPAGPSIYESRGLLAL